MRVLTFFPIIILISIFSCRGNTKPIKIKNNIPKKDKVQEIKKEQTSLPTPIKNLDTIPKKIPLPSESDSIDYWVTNNCSYPKPQPTVPTEKRPNYYSFKINNKSGYGKEILRMENGYKLDITTSGCDESMIKFSYFMYAKDLDVTDQLAVTKKILELMEMTAQVSHPPFDFKSKISQIKEAAKLAGTIEQKKKMILGEGGKDVFEFDYLQQRKGKIFLSYYFTREKK